MEGHIIAMAPLGSRGTRYAAVCSCPYFPSPIFIASAEHCMSSIWLLFLFFSCLLSVVNQYHVERGILFFWTERRLFLNTLALKYLISYILTGLMYLRRLVEYVYGYLVHCIVGEPMQGVDSSEPSCGLREGPCFESALLLINVLCRLRAQSLHL